MYMGEGCQNLLPCNIKFCPAKVAFIIWQYILHNAIPAVKIKDITASSHLIYTKIVLIPCRVHARDGFSDLSNVALATSLLTS